MYAENKITSCANCARCWTNFRNLTEEELELINKNRYEATFKPSEIIIKQGAHIKVQKVTDKTLSGQGTRLGTAYRLANGQVVYVPDEETKPR